MQKVRLASQFGDNYLLSTDSQDKAATLEYVPKKIRKAAEKDGFTGSLFVLVGEGELLEIWACRSLVVWNDSAAVLLWDIEGHSNYSEMYTVLMGNRDGFLPDSEPIEFSTIQDLKQFLSNQKRELIDEGWKVATLTPLKQITRGLFRKYQSVEYIQYEPQEASEYYNPYSIEIIFN